VVKAGAIVILTLVGWYAVINRTYGARYQYVYEEVSPYRTASYFPRQHAATIDRPFRIMPGLPMFSLAADG
jgi:hypothetical protein